LYGYRHLRSAAAADDLVQEVLLRTIEALRAGRLRDVHKLAPFVLGTCRTTVLEWRRTAHRRQRLLDEFGGMLVPDHGFAPDLDDERLARCVQLLAERERSVVAMSFYDEQTTAEAAVLLSASEANVRVIRHRALKRLRTCMGANA
jgi:RNA polymerase sigma-70 factor (ECF subfamily)